MVAVVHRRRRIAVDRRASPTWLDQVGAAYSPTSAPAIAKALDSARAALRRRSRRRTASPGSTARSAPRRIVAGLKLDADSVRAALLLGCADHRRLRRRSIRRSVRRRGRADRRRRRAHGRDPRRARQRAASEERDLQAENLRKMLLAMVEDIRVVLIKLAERTQALRFLIGSDDAGDRARRPRARRSISSRRSPTASASGSSSGSSRTLACARSSPRPTSASRSCSTSGASTASTTSTACTATLKRELAAAGIKAEVTGRAKHIYSIWNKMQRKESGIESLYDIRAVRILVDDVKDCYAALGVVHNLWTPRAARVRRLHREAEGQRLPLAAHRRDRPRGQAARGADPHLRDAPALRVRRRRALALQGRRARRAPRSRFDEKIAWLRQVLDWKDAVADAGEWLQQFKSSLFTDTIYVLTPQGKVIDLPRGATPVDFAYAVHTSLGHRCRGAKRRRRDGAAQLRARERTARRDHRGEEGGPRRATGSTPSSATSRATARAPRCGSGSRRSRSRRRSRAAARWSSASSRAPGLTAVKLDAVAAEAGYAKTDEFFAAVARDRDQSARGAERDPRSRASPRPPRPRRPRANRCRRGRARPRARAAAFSSSASTD